MEKCFFFFFQGCCSEGNFSDFFSVSSFLKKLLRISFFFFYNADKISLRQEFLQKKRKTEISISLKFEEIEGYFCEWGVRKVKNVVEDIYCTINDFFEILSWSPRGQNIVRLKVCSLFRIIMNLATCFDSYCQLLVDFLMILTPDIFYLYLSSRILLPK